MSTKVFYNIESGITMIEPADSKNLAKQLHALGSDNNAVKTYTFKVYEVENEEKRFINCVQILVKPKVELKAITLPESEKF